MFVPTMAPHKILFKNFFKKNADESQKEEGKIDFFSKMYLIIELVLGINRLNIIGVKNYKLRLLGGFSSLLVPIFVVYNIFMKFYSNLLMRIDYPNVIQYVVCIIFAFVFHKRLFAFYKELSKFDDETNYVQKMSVRSVYILVHFIVITIISAILSNVVSNEFLFWLDICALKLLHSVELHYYGHLISMLIPRVKTISEYFKLQYSDEHGTINMEISDESHRETIFTYVNLKKAIDSYNKIIATYKALYEAIKWQMLIHISATFGVSLLSIYHTAINYINGQVNMSYMYINTSFFLLIFESIVIPCLAADHLATEVSDLRQIIIAGLYENTLDKPSRRSARVLLALTKNCKLSLSLFHMFDINIALLFKISGLLITYLVIMLQFDKYMFSMEAV